ncbi:MAG: Rrf2 family transcriptional regulator [Gammaproteobacteria bacterium]|nr:Rrf2 family transcriptional regulator [Gammaproteobacteria bacterium]
MRLTTQTDYALRVLMHAALMDGELDRIDNVAADFGISRNHLSKVVHNLSASGYLQTVQGRNGGFRLAHDPVNISVGQVVRDFEPDFNLVECFDSATSQCAIQKNCVLAGAFDGALTAFLDRLDQVSLKDLIRPRRKLTLQLGLTGRPVTRLAAGR